MSRIKSKNTVPELLIRRMLHKAGFRFRINYGRLPGSPDIVLPKYKTVIFVHGCFWHSHSGCRRANIPKSNSAYWTVKLEKNKTRDAEAKQELTSAGWSVFIVWECEVKQLIEDPGRLIQKLKSILK